MSGTILDYLLSSRNRSLEPLDSAIPTKSSAMPKLNEDYDTSSNSSPDLMASTSPSSLLLMSSSIVDTHHHQQQQHYSHDSSMSNLASNFTTNPRFNDSYINNSSAYVTTTTALTTTAAGELLLAQTMDMSKFELAFWIVIFTIMVLIAFGGNLIVALIVCKNKEMKSVTNYFLVNLSLADAMVSTLNVVFNFISMVISNWPFGLIYCKISNFIAILSISASVFTLTAISCDRYNAILHPLRPRMSHSRAVSWILFIWSLSALVAAPNAIFSTLVGDKLADESEALTCAMMWPDGRYPHSSYDHAYNIVIFVLTYLIPITTMAILYYKVGKELWGFEAIGENVEKQRRAILAKKKIVKMMIVVVIIFAICWLPYHAFFIFNYYMPTLFQDLPDWYQRCYLFMYWLAMSNSMYNPIIIYFMNSKFRHEIRRSICLVCCCRAWSPTRTRSSSLTRNTSMSAFYKRVPSGTTTLTSPSMVPLDGGVAAAGTSERANGATPSIDIT